MRILLSTLTAAFLMAAVAAPVANAAMMTKHHTMHMMKHHTHCKGEFMMMMKGKCVDARYS